MAAVGSSILVMFALAGLSCFRFGHEELAVGGEGTREEPDERGGGGVQKPIVLARNKKRTWTHEGGNLTPTPDAGTCCGVESGTTSVMQYRVGDVHALPTSTSTY